MYRIGTFVYLATNVRSWISRNLHEGKFTGRFIPTILQSLILLAAKEKRRIIFLGARFLLSVD